MNYNMLVKSEIKCIKYYLRHEKNIEINMKEKLKHINRIWGKNRNKRNHLFIKKE